MPRSFYVEEVQEAVSYLRKDDTFLTTKLYPLLLFLVIATQISLVAVWRVKPAHPMPLAQLVALVDAVIVWTVPAYLACTAFVSWAAARWLEVARPGRVLFLWARWLDVGALIGVSSLVGVGANLSTIAAPRLIVIVLFLIASWLGRDYILFMAARSWLESGGVVPKPEPCRDCGVEDRASC